MGGIFFKISSVKFSGSNIYSKSTGNGRNGFGSGRPYSVWLLKTGENRLSQDLDPSTQPTVAPPLSTPRPNRTH